MSSEPKWGETKMGRNHKVECGKLEEILRMFKDEDYFPNFGKDPTNPGKQTYDHIALMSSQHFSKFTKQSFSEQTRRIGRNIKAEMEKK